ncbi:MAG: histidinol-phosphate transaminase [Ruminococcaceae bacterium]|nr:histidinol-phosphate transaminase [Oscillospiraceae bacterium]
MSRFFLSKYDKLVAYTPGEQPRDQQYIKLNTNESPFPPSAEVSMAVAKEAEKLSLYSDPENRQLTELIAKHYGLEYENCLLTNGSDEILNFCYMAFFENVVFPDITYGFYPVLADLHNISYEIVPLKEDFTIDYRDYCGINKNIIIANPNAPTGLLLSLFEIEEIIRTNPNNIVVIDEAYIDFSETPATAIPLISKYDNLIVVKTFSKSGSLAGARLGLGLANKSLINDLNVIKYSTNPYNINRLTNAAGIAAIKNWQYYEDNCKTVIENRKYTENKLKELGFRVLPSQANFIFAQCPYIKGKELYLSLKKMGVLVRHFDTERLKSYIRITIGSREEMDILIDSIIKIKNQE